MRVGAVIAAAGKSGGYKSYDKMKSVDGIQVLRQMILNFKRAGVDEIVLITGYQGIHTILRRNRPGSPAQLMQRLPQRAYRPERGGSLLERGVQRRFPYLNHSEPGSPDRPGHESGSEQSPAETGFQQ